jgi:hypothetical protein
MPQPASITIAEALARLVPDLDALVRDAELGRPGNQLHLHDLEERAQRLASALVAPFRGPSARPVNPIRRDRDGRYGG